MRADEKRAEDIRKLGEDRYAATGWGRSVNRRCAFHMPKGAAMKNDYFRSGDVRRGSGGSRRVAVRCWGTAAPGEKEFITGQYLSA